MSGKYVHISEHFVALADYCQNTEDEVLKAAIAKYGKNQWCIAVTFYVRDRVLMCFALQGAYIFATRSQDSQAMQSTVVRVVGPLYQEDRVVEGAFPAQLTSP